MYIVRVILYMLYTCKCILCVCDMLHTLCLYIIYHIPMSLPNRLIVIRLCLHLCIGHQRVPEVLLHAQIHGVQLEHYCG